MKKMSNTQKLKLLYSSIDPNSSDYKRNKSSNIVNNTPNSSRVIPYNQPNIGTPFYQSHGGGGSQ